MKKTLYLLLFIFTTFWTACSPSTQFTDSDVEYPVAVAFLDNGSIEFRCKEPADCFPSIELDNFGLENEQQVLLGSVFYLNPGRIGIFLRSGLSQYLVRIDGATEKIDILTLPENLEIVFLWETFRDKVIIANKGYHTGENLWIIDEDFSIQSVPFELTGKLPTISNLVVSSDKHVLVLNGSPVEEDGKIFAQVFAVDVESFTAKEERFELSGMKISHGPNEVYVPESNYLFKITNISPDLKNIYYFYHHYHDEEETDLFFGKAASADFQLEKSTSDLGCDGLMMVDNRQYRDMFYYNQTDIDGNIKATLYDLTNLDFIISEDANAAGGEMISPFGDHFVIGDEEGIKLITRNNELLSEYTLPKAIQPCNYQIVQYRDADMVQTIEEN